jgi:hypothetical protein
VAGPGGIRRAHDVDDAIPVISVKVGGGGIGGGTAGPAIAATRGGISFRREEGRRVQSGGIEGSRGVVVVVGTNKTTPTMVAVEASSTSTIVRSVT